MIKKLLAIVYSVLYMMLFLVCCSVSATVFFILGHREFTAIGAAFVGILALCLIKKIRRESIKEGLSLIPITARDAALIAAFTIPITVLVQCVQFVVPARYLGEADYALPYGAASAFSIMFTSPIMEEAFFRGCILKTLCGSFPAAVAVGVSSFLFSGMHSGIVWQLAALLISIFYSTLFIKYKSLLAPITAHITSNVLAVCFMLFS